MNKLIVSALLCLASITASAQNTQGPFRAYLRVEFYSNKKPELTDAIRAPYYYGDKSIYNLSEVNEDFDIGITAFNYLIMYFMGVALVWDLAVIIMTTVARIFNMMMLYLVSPLVFAAEPLDDGAKRKQWVTAFLVQAAGIFGTIIAMRVLMIFIPIIIGPRLQIFPHDTVGYTILDIAAKVIMIYAGFEVVKKANGIITGILADSAGWQSIQAGDMSAKGDASQSFFKSFVGSPIATTKASATGFRVEFYSCSSYIREMKKRGGGSIAQTASLFWKFIASFNRCLLLECTGCAICSSMPRHHKQFSSLSTPVIL